MYAKLIESSLVILSGAALACGGSSPPSRSTTTGTNPGVDRRDAPDVTVSRYEPVTGADTASPTAEPVEPVAPPPGAVAGELVDNAVDDSPTDGVNPEAVIAVVVLQTTNGGGEAGNMTFSQTGDWVELRGSFSGLQPGERGLQIRSNGDCGGKHAERSGEHFNPTDARHGPPSSSQRHAGDFGNLTVDETGNATFEMRTDSLTVTEGASSIVGRSVVVTRRADNGKSQPWGNAGPPVACGVIELE